MKDPAFLFYTSDFLTGTVFMNDDQVGKYIRLLCVQHQHGGLIPKAHFNNILGTDNSNDLVRIKFIEVQSGFFNERLMKEMEKRELKSENLSHNALKRWKKHKKCKSNAIASVRHMPIEDDNRDVISNVKRGMQGGEKDLFERWYLTYPKRQARGAAEKAWKSIKPDEKMVDVMIKAVECQKNTENWKKEGGKYIPLPSTWLNQKRWEDVIDVECSKNETFLTGAPL